MADGKMLVTLRVNVPKGQLPFADEKRLAKDWLTKLVCRGWSWRQVLPALPVKAMDWKLTSCWGNYWQKATATISVIAFSRIREIGPTSNLLTRSAGS